VFDLDTLKSYADGSKLATSEIQKLLDQCGNVGGGVVRIPAGTYLVGGLELHDNTRVVLEPGCILKGSLNLSDYPLHSTVEDYPFDEGQEGVRAIFFARNCHNISLTGGGMIQGGGKGFDDCGTRRARPRNILFAGCDGVTVRDIRLEESGFWNQHYLQCRNVLIENVRVHSLHGINNDGLDIDSCFNVVVRNCRIDSQDDAICLKCNTSVPCENVIVTDCITTTHANHFKLGTETHGGFRNIQASNLIMIPSEMPVSTHVGGGDYRGASGIALGAVDGAFMENVVVENVTMDGVRVPFYLRHGDCRRSFPGLAPSAPAYVKGITLRHIVAKHASAQGCYLIGLPDTPMKEIRIEESSFEFEGCPDEARLAIQVPDDRKIYCTMEAFGILPSYGVFSRYVEDLTLENVRFSTLADDLRPAVRHEKCCNVRISVTDVVGTQKQK